VIEGHNYPAAFLLLYDAVAENEVELQLHRLDDNLDGLDQHIPSTLSPATGSARAHSARVYSCG